MTIPRVLLIPRLVRGAATDNNERSDVDKAKGKMKEAAGAMTNDEDKRTEGKAQQRKGSAEAEMTKKEKAKQTEEEARQTEKDLDRQRRKDKGLLGNVKDTLPGK